MIELLLLTISLLTAATLLGHYQEIRPLFVVAKPATTIAVLILALLPIASGTSEPALYTTLVVIGLVFSLGGDIGLMFGKRGFVLGLASFLLGHIAYAVAFFPQAELTTLLFLPVIVLLYGSSYLAYLLPHVGRLKIPVLAYVLSISCMLWFAISRGHALQTEAAIYAAAGALFFALSDSVLGINRFVKPFPAAQAIILTTYWAGQSLIALSVHP